MKSKSKSSHQIRDIVTHQSPYLNKKNENNEGEYVIIWWCNVSQHQSSKVPDWSQNFEKFFTKEVFTDCDEIEEESNEDYDDINYDKVLSLVNSKLLLAKTIKIICSIFWASLYSIVSHYQMKWGREFETGKASIMTIICNFYRINRCTHREDVS